MYFILRFPTLSKNSISPFFFLKKRKYERVFFFFLYNERRKTKKKKVTTFFFSLSRSSPFFFLFTFVDKKWLGNKSGQGLPLLFLLKRRCHAQGSPSQKKKTNPKINARREKERETLTAMRKKKIKKKRITAYFEAVNMEGEKEQKGGDRDICCFISIDFLSCYWWCAVAFKNQASRPISQFNKKSVTRCTSHIDARSILTFAGFFFLKRKGFFFLLFSPQEKRERQEILGI